MASWSRKSESFPNRREGAEGRELNSDRGSELIEYCRNCGQTFPRDRFEAHKVKCCRHPRRKLAANV
jgi:hypothetical protein